ncbi:hypothetical protein Tco_0214247 [Tanacetum coccineum]
MAAVNDVSQLINKKGGSYAAIAPKLEPDDIMKSVISCVSAKETWTDLVHSFEGPLDTKENKIMDLKLKLQENSDDEVDERSSEEYLRDLDIEYQERALLANSKMKRNFLFHDDASLLDLYRHPTKGDAPAKPPTNNHPKYNFQISKSCLSFKRRISSPTKDKDGVYRYFLQPHRQTGLLDRKKKGKLELTANGCFHRSSQTFSWPDDARIWSIQDKECNLKVQKMKPCQEASRGQDFKPVRTEKEALMTMMKMDRGSFASIRETDPGNIMTSTVHKIPTDHPLKHNELEEFFDMDVLGTLLYTGAPLKIIKTPKVGSVYFWRSKWSIRGSKEVIDIDVQPEEDEELLVVSSTSRPAAGSEHNATRRRKSLNALALKHLGPYVPTSVYKSSKQRKANLISQDKSRGSQVPSRANTNLGIMVLLGVENSEARSTWAWKRKCQVSLTHNPPVYDSLVKQFWQTATARTLADGTQQLNATIDTIEYTITEESVRRQLQLADASGIHMCKMKRFLQDCKILGQTFKPSADHTPSQSIPTTSLSHVQIPQPPPTATHSVQPPPQPSSVQPTAITPPTQPVQTTSPPPVSSIPDIQPTQPPSPQIPSPSIHIPEASISSEECEQLRNLNKAKHKRQKSYLQRHRCFWDNTDSTPSAQVNTGEVNTGETERVQRRKGKEPMTEEDLQAEVQASKKSKELQELADLEEAQRLQAKMDAETQRQIDLDALLARRLVEQEEEAAQEALATEFDYIQARLNADQILAEKLQQEEREQYSIEDRAKFLHDTIAAQRKFLAEQRSAAIRNKPPTISQLRNQMITYLKHVANKKHAELKSKSFEEIQVLYERYKKQDQTFVAIGTEEDERAIKKMNEKATHKEEEKKDESVHEEVKEEEGAKKRKLGTRRKLKAKRRKHASGLTREDDDLKICLHIAPDEDKVIDVESLNQQYPIIEWQSFFLTTKPQHDQTKPDEDIYLNKVTRSNGHQRFFRTLMGVLSILDREDLKIIYELVMEEYKDRLPEGFDRMLWGDLMIMFNQGDTADFWDTQQDWNLISWKLHSSSGVHTIMTSTGLVFHMLVESRYPLTKEVLSQMLELKLETEEESSMALELIKFVKQQLEEFEDSNDDDHGEEERV